MSERVEFIKGCIRMLVLKLLSERPMYGYEISYALADRSRGVFSTRHSTVYPLLYSLEKRGLIRISRGVPPAAGRHRRYYELTPAGRQELKKDLGIWSDMVRGVAFALGPQRPRSR